MISLIRNIFIAFLIAIGFTGCLNEDEDNCLTNIDYYRGLEFKIVLKRKGKIGKSVALAGINPDTHLEARHSNTAGYLYLKYDLYNIGDTIIKDKGAFYIKIKKPDKVLLVNLDCSELKIDSINYKFVSNLKTK